MTFTYDLSTDIGRVRLRIGDRTSPGIRSDEEIQALIDQEGDWKKACIGWIESVINELNMEPDSTADWLEIDINTMRESLYKMLGELKNWLGVSGAGNITRVIAVYRADSFQTKAPDDW